MNDNLNLTDFISGSLEEVANGIKSANGKLEGRPFSLVTTFGNDNKNKGYAL